MTYRSTSYPFVIVGIGEERHTTIGGSVLVVVVVVVIRLFVLLLVVLLLSIVRRDTVPTVVDGSTAMTTLPLPRLLPLRTTTAFHHHHIPRYESSPLTPQFLIPMRNWNIQRRQYDDTIRTTIPSSAHFLPVTFPSTNPSALRALPAPTTAWLSRLGIPIAWSHRLPFVASSCNHPTFPPVLFWKCRRSASFLTSTTFTSADIADYSNNDRNDDDNNSTNNSNKNIDSEDNFGTSLELQGLHTPIIVQANRTGRTSSSSRRMDHTSTTPMVVDMVHRTLFQEILPTILLANHHHPPNDPDESTNTTTIPVNHSPFSYRATTTPTTTATTSSSSRRAGETIYDITIVLGVSGGCDSMALLRILHTILFASSTTTHSSTTTAHDTTTRMAHTTTTTGPGPGTYIIWNMIVVHFDHQQRGKVISDQERQLVQTLCQQLHLPCYVYTWDEQRLSNPAAQHVSFSQTTARQWRRRTMQHILSQQLEVRRRRQGYPMTRPRIDTPPHPRKEEDEPVMDEHRNSNRNHDNNNTNNNSNRHVCCGMIMTAHHQDDSEETMLLKLLRGVHVTNIAGLATVQPCHNSSPPYSVDTFAYDDNDDDNYSTANTNVRHGDDGDGESSTKMYWVRPLIHVRKMEIIVYGMN
jgi:hypothetical protein